MIMTLISVDGSIDILIWFIRVLANRREVGRFSPVTPGDELDMIG